MPLTFCERCGEELVAPHATSLCGECSQTIATHWDPQEAGSICHEGCAIALIASLRDKIYRLQQEIALLKEQIDV